METSSKLAQYQSDLAHYCRTGEEVKIPGVRQDRIKNYRELVFNVISGNIEQNFPILHRVVGDEKMQELIDDFFRHHSCQSPQIWKLSKEFYEYGVEANWAKIHQMPWINDILCIEWVETEVFTMPDMEQPKYIEPVNYLDETLAINPEHLLFQLQYPVHKYPVAEAEKLPGEYYVLAFRHPEAGTVHFEDLSVFYTELVMLLSDNPLSVRAIVEELVDKYQLRLNNDDWGKIESFVKLLHQNRFILGRLD